jgi:hypothetical protein
MSTTVMTGSVTSTVKSQASRNPGPRSVKSTVWTHDGKATPKLAHQYLQVCNEDIEECYRPYLSVPRPSSGTYQALPKVSSAVGKLATEFAGTSPLQSSLYVRDLTREGIEPNPGFRGRGGRRPEGRRPQGRKRVTPEEKKRREAQSRRDKKVSQKKVVHKNQTKKNQKQNKQNKNKQQQKHKKQIHPQQKHPQRNDLQIVRTVEAMVRPRTRPVAGNKAATRFPKHVFPSMARTMSKALAQTKFMANQPVVHKGVEGHHVKSGQILVMAPQVINFDRGSYIDQSSTAGVLSYHMIMSEMFTAVGWRTAPPRIKDICLPTGGVAGKLSPSFVRMFLLWAHLDLMRDTGSLMTQGSDTDVFALFPPFPAAAKVPVGWLNYIRGYCPYTDSNGVTFQNQWTISPTVFGATLENELDSSATLFAKSHSGAFFPCYLTQGNANGSAYEYAHQGGFTKASITWQAFFDGWEAISDWWASVFPCDSLENVKRTAPDASAYVFNLGGALVCATNEYNPEHSVLYVQPVKKLNVTGFAYPKSVGIPIVEDTSGGTPYLAGVDGCLGFLANYAMLSLDYERLGTIHEAHLASIWAPVTTYAPNLTCVDMRSLQQVICACVEAFAVDSETAAVMHIVLWSKFLRATARATAMAAALEADSAMFLNHIHPIFAVFDELLVPPAFAEWVSGFGPVIIEGRVNWPYVMVPISHNTYPSWIRFLAILSTGPAQSLPICSLYPNMIRPGGQIVGGVTYNTTNFPSTRTFPLVPTFQDVHFVDAYTALDGYENFVPMEVTRFGLIEMACAAGVEVADQPLNGQFGGSYGYIFANGTDVTSITTPRVVGGADAMRALTHGYRTVNQTTVNTMLQGFRSSRFQLLMPPYAFARYMSVGKGWTVLGQELANREAEENVGVSVDGITVTPPRREDTELGTVRNIANDFFVDAAKALTGLEGRSIGDLAKEAVKSSASIITSEFIPFGGPLLEAGIELGSKVVRKILGTTESHEVKRRARPEKDHI